MIKIELERIKGDFGFVARDEANHTIQIDSSKENGGENFGARPMQTILMALGACSGIDVVSILKKQRQAVQSFKMKIQGERDKEKIPSLWKSIHIHFELSGKIELEKAEKACTLSVEKYCSVAETLRRAGAHITWQITLFNS